ncbi:MAG: hypothetical protein PHS65_01395 [Arcobacteraceae bacterium]|nr:hypothetical protein [Arcobacteraceae bacterium]
MHTNWIRLKISEQIILDLQEGKQLDTNDYHVEKHIQLNFKNNEITELFKKIIRVTKQNYFNTLHEIFTDLEHFDFRNEKSVNTKIKSYNSYENNNFTLRESIDLMEHTCNVVNEAIEISKDQNDGSKAIILLLSLTHDFGKSDNVREYIKTSKTERHDIVSAKYLQVKLLNNKELDHLSNEHIEEIYNILSTHHDENVKTKSTIVELFHKADIIASKKEIKKLTQQQAKGATHDN